MSVPRSARCLARQSRLSNHLSVPASRQCIHQSTRRSQSAKPVPSNRTPAVPKNASIRNPKYSLSQARVTDEVPLTREEALKNFPQYTEEELGFLRRKYTPEQMASIEAGEAAIDPYDILTQGAARTDSMRVKYLDDFRNIDPVVDKQRRAPQSNWDPDLRLKTDDEIDEDLAEFWEQAAKKGQDQKDLSLDFEKWLQNYRYTVGKEEAERDAPDYLAPELGKLTDPMVKRTVPDQDQDARGSQEQEHWDRLSTQTGLSVAYMKDLKEKTLSTNFVSNQTRLGKVQSILMITVVGNGNGLVGIGLGKSTSGTAAAFQAKAEAIRNMAPIPRYEGRTIYGDVSAKVGATVVNLFHRPPGFGLRCQGKVYEIARCAGIKDLAAKLPRNSNPMNVIKATFEALTKQRLPDSVAKGRGWKMVDVRKVYYAGLN